MKIWTCKRFTGYWPVGTAAVVHAEDEVTAAEILNQELRLQKLPGDAKAEDMIEFSKDKVRILCDGNY